MGSEGNAAASSSSSSPTATTAGVASPSIKRGRDPEDEVYVDNLHSHKRYLSEIMASSLNGLTVGDPLSENLMDSPLRDEISVQYSPMSEDSDDSRYYESSTNTCSSQPESAPTSPVSPYRCQKPLSGFVSGPPTTSYPSPSGIASPSASPQPRQRGSDTEGRFPSSPSDICHSADLRRAALLRSVQMRAQPVGSSNFELPLSPGQESGNNIESEERPCSYMKLDVDERGYQIAECENEDKSSEISLCPCCKDVLLDGFSLDCWLFEKVLAHWH
ncbi:uncharacterized protein LOC105163067 isoform X2 [Sesamum indicum]|uniref:Uncharacterized protein LOC105163067 isoform X2 n=1 Tax=Sesamum indicum TaxID=4182 RepID=A0A8M8V2X7_SESIN|nr:uncharacterized protein LOC105163067 isoform X2 [Sesamum indicum]